MNTLKTALVIALGLLAGGCMTMTDSECRGANWYEIGEREALIYGLRPQIEIYEHLCQQHGLHASEKDYMAGWNVGQGERIRRGAGEGCCSPR
jgi:hypothetical protein